MGKIRKNQVIFGSEKLRFICFGPQHSPTIEAKVEENWVHGRAEAEWGEFRGHRHFAEWPFHDLVQTFVEALIPVNLDGPKSMANGVDGQGTQHSSFVAVKNLLLVFVENKPEESRGIREK